MKRTFKKTIHTDYVDMDIAIPSNSNGEYESQLIKKYQSNSRQGRENAFYVCQRNDDHRHIVSSNAIEGFNCQLRKVTKSKTVFPSDESL